MVTTVILPAEMDAMTAVATALRMHVRKSDRTKITVAALHSKFAVEFLQTRMAQPAPGNQVGMIQIKMLKYVGYLVKLKKALKRFASPRSKLETTLKV